MSPHNKLVIKEEPDSKTTLLYHLNHMILISVHYYEEYSYKLDASCSTTVTLSGQALKRSLSSILLAISCCFLQKCFILFFCFPVKEIESS